MPEYSTLLPSSRPVIDRLQSATVVNYDGYYYTVWYVWQVCYTFYGGMLEEWATDPLLPMYGRVGSRGMRVGQDHCTNAA